MKMRKLLFGMLFAPMALGSNIALADGWPASVVGFWDLFGSQSRTTLQITSQGSTGDCRPIAGQCLVPHPSQNRGVQGFYCPHSGRIHFLLKLPGTNTTFQVFAGNLSMTGG